MRVAVISCVFCLLSAEAGAQLASIDSLVAMPPAERSAALLRIRNSDDASTRLRELEAASRERVEARRQRGLPPHTDGCLDANEFDLDSQLRIARLAPGDAEFSTALGQYRELADKLDAKLAFARRTNAWWQQFPSLRRWERDWRAAKDPRTRELLLRTLHGQAIRAALARERKPAEPSVTKGSQQRKARSATSALAINTYREYVFNLMCTDDEDNLAWFKRQVAEIGWFGQKEYGWAADQAALLIAQHADADPGFQEAVVAGLWPRVAKSDTDPENFAYLVDRVAVRTGRPQSFGTQMECVNGTWFIPEIQDQATLDERRKRMNLVTYQVQLERVRGFCRN